MRTKKIPTILALSLVLLICLSPLAALAEEKTGYNLLSPLPNTGGQTGASDFGGYLNQMFRLAIGMAAIFAVFFMVVGGIEYMSTDAWTGKKEGMKKIQNAFWGLVLVLASWLILNTINPDILKLKLDIEPATVKIDQAKQNSIIKNTTQQEQEKETGAVRKLDSPTAILQDIKDNPNRYGVIGDVSAIKVDVLNSSSDTITDQEIANFASQCRSKGRGSLSNAIPGKVLCIYR